MPLAATYRHRQPENAAFYQRLEDSWDEFKESSPYFYEPAFAPTGPNPPSGVFTAISIESFSETSEIHQLPLSGNGRSNSSRSSPLT